MIAERSRLSGELPSELLEADAAYHRLLQQVAFSQHLNPVNGPQARALFMRGMEAPPLLYDAPLWAEEALALLDGLVIPRMHPLGEELARAAAQTRLLIVALQERTAEAFAALNAASGWGALIEAELPEPEPDLPVPGSGLDAAEMRRVLEEALEARGLSGWRVEADPVMSARVLVDSPKKLLRVHPGALFHAADRAGLVAHEIDVHVMRGVAGQRQPLRLFSSGLAGADRAEEGLAIHAERRAGTLSNRFPHRQRIVHQAIARAAEQGFREIYEWLLGETGASFAWGVCLRIKRGLKAPDQPGVYAKDCIYLRGYREVGAWLAAESDIDMLYVGKVGLHHPVAEWIAAGWIAPGTAPQIWK